MIRLHKTVRLNPVCTYKFRDSHKDELSKSKLLLNNLYAIAIL